MRETKNLKKRQKKIKKQLTKVKKTAKIAKSPVRAATGTLITEQRKNKTFKTVFERRQIS